MGEGGDPTSNSDNMEGEGILITRRGSRRSRAEMPSMAVSPRLASAGSVLAVGPNLSFNAAKLEKEICPGPWYLRAISLNCEVRSLALAMIP